MKGLSSGCCVHTSTKTHTHTHTASALPPLRFPPRRQSIYGVYYLSLGKPTFTLSSVRYKPHSSLRSCCSSSLFLFNHPPPCPPPSPHHHSAERWLLLFRSRVSVFISCLPDLSVGAMSSDSVIKVASERQYPKARARHCGRVYFCSSRQVLPFASAAHPAFRFLAKSTFSTHPSIRLSACPSVHQFTTCPTVRVSIRPTNNPPTHPFIPLSLYLSFTHLCTQLYIHPFTHLYLSVHPSINASNRPTHPPSIPPFSASSDCFVLDLIAQFRLHSLAIC